MKRHVLALFLIVAMSAGHIAAGFNADVVPGRWEKVGAQKAGTRLTVILKSGENADGTLVGTDSSSITIRQPGASSERVIPKADVARVTTDKWVSDPAYDGALIGVVAGAALFASAGAGLCIFCSGSNRAASAVVFGAIGAGVGAAVGYGIDKARKNSEWRVELLYEAVRP